MVAINSSCFRRQLDCFLGGSGLSDLELLVELCNFGFIGLSVEISVPSALCLLESNTFLRFAADFWQMGTCFLRTLAKKFLPHILHATRSSEMGGDSSISSIIYSWLYTKDDAVATGFSS